MILPKIAVSFGFSQMLWNYKTCHFSPKMRQMMYPDCKTTLDNNEIEHIKTC